ncbi:hypothetical protein CHLRE_16g658300v5 [Chlamydomonas reinhardtii]|uniref:SET domain-containing protein n=1 Tax=Chlamydomonas reinhardtii TaxID=3055 RepID=A0A2K3CTC7_CHLRE|nr:uncharacterized protein CHLRE_16g658300v5 [Chlamydomonas reinhardtii]PNW71535.1 hypothetical protein CHLRE_16g658300v5 [Chlamydomonas reinhardtii]
MGATTDGQSPPARTQAQRTGRKIRQTSPPLGLNYSLSSSAGPRKGVERGKHISQRALPLRSSPERTLGPGDDGRTHDQDPKQRVSRQGGDDTELPAPPAAARDPTSPAPAAGPGTAPSARPAARTSSPPVVILDDDDYDNCGEQVGSPSSPHAPASCSSGAAASTGVKPAVEPPAQPRDQEPPLLRQRQLQAVAPEHREEQQQQQQHPGLPGLPAQRWHAARPGYAELAEAVAARRSLPPPPGTAPHSPLPSGWGVGLLGGARVVLNSRLSPALEEMHGAMQEGLLAQQRQVGAAAAGKQQHQHQQGSSLVELTSGLDLVVAAAADTDGGQQGCSCCQQAKRGKGRGRGGRHKKGDETPTLASKAAADLAEQLRSAVAAELGLGRPPTDLEVALNLPELLPANPKVRVMRIGDPGVPPSVWDDVPCMSGAASLVALQPVAAGEVLGLYSGELALKAEYHWLCESPLPAWDDPDPRHPCPYTCALHFAHEMGRYAVDTDLPAPLVQQLSEARGGQLAPGLARELRRGGAESVVSLTLTARRLGCGLAAINDPRRNLAATWEEDADFADGHPNAELASAVVLGMWPVVLAVAKRDIPAGTHVSASYGCDYWSLHRAEQQALSRIEQERRLAQAAAQRAERAEAAAAEARQQAAQWQTRAAAAQQRAQEEVARAAAAEQRAAKSEGCARAAVRRLEGDMSELRAQAARELGDAQAQASGSAAALASAKQQLQRLQEERRRLLQELEGGRQQLEQVEVRCEEAEARCKEAEAEARVAVQAMAHKESKRGKEAAGSRGGAPEALGGRGSGGSGGGALAAVAQARAAAGRANCAVGGAGMYTAAAAARASGRQQWRAGEQAAGASGSCLQGPSQGQQQARVAAGQGQQQARVAVCRATRAAAPLVDLSQEED